MDFAFSFYIVGLRNEWLMMLLKGEKKQKEQVKLANRMVDIEVLVMFGVNEIFHVKKIFQI